jgi:hypothetical protein
MTHQRQSAIASKRQHFRQGFERNTLAENEELFPHRLRTGAVVAAYGFNADITETNPGTPARIKSQARGGREGTESPDAQVSREKRSRVCFNHKAERRRAID